MTTNKNIPLKLYIDSDLCTAASKRAKELNLSMSSFGASLMAREVSKPISCSNNTRTVVYASRPKVAQKRIIRVNKKPVRMPPFFKLRQ